MWRHIVTDIAADDISPPLFKIIWVFYDLIFIGTSVVDVNYMYMSYVMLDVGD